MSNIDIKLNGNNTITINDMLDGVVTITTKDINSDGTVCNFTYNVSPDGRVITINQESHIDDESLIEKPMQNASKQAMIGELSKEGFEEIPNDLSEVDLRNILDFSRTKIEKGNEYLKMFPYSVKVTSTGDLDVILLMYNGSNNAISLTKFPFKLKDAENKVLIADAIDINKTVSPYKTAICEIQIEKTRLSEQLPDLTTWTVTFEMQ